MTQEEFATKVNDTVDSLVEILKQGKTREEVINIARNELHDYVWLAELSNVIIPAVTENQMSSHKKYYPNVVIGVFEEVSSKNMDGG